MTIAKGKVDEVIRLTEQGYSQEKITEITGVSERTQRNWKQKGYLGKSKVNIAPTKKLSPSDVPKVTAADLVKAGFRPDKVHILLGALGIAFKQGNDRLAQFFSNYIDVGKQWDGVHPIWRALIAGFPIIGEDIGSQSLKDLAELVKEMHPYLDKMLRREYHKRARPILLGILAELQAFLQDAAMAGGLPLAVIAGPPISWKPWDSGLGKSFKMDESLSKGNWEVLIPSEVFEYGIDISRTWAGFLYDMISRLPDPDKQKGKLLKKMDLLNEIYIWCSTAPSDFKPPLANIIHRSVDSSENSLVGIYKRWAENADNPSE